MKIYIAGKITGDPDYKHKFSIARIKLRTEGHVVLCPSDLPGELSNADYVRICFAMIDSADAVAFLSDWRDSRGATLEHGYCQYISKQTMYLRDVKNEKEIELTMKIEEYTERLEFIKSMAENEVISPCLVEYLTIAAIDYALEATKEKLNRECGCPLCKSKHIRIDVKTKNPNDAYYFSTEPGVGLKYCPMCGRKVEERDEGN